MGMKYIKNVVTIKLNKDKCIGCEMCIKVCPHGVFSYLDKEIDIVNRDYCIECGACAKNCPTRAIDVKSGVG